MSGQVNATIQKLIMLTLAGWMCCWARRHLMVVSPSLCWLSSIILQVTKLQILSCKVCLCYSAYLKIWNAWCNWVVIIDSQSSVCRNRLPSEAYHSSHFKSVLVVKLSSYVMSFSSHVCTCSYLLLKAHPNSKTASVIVSKYWRPLDNYWLTEK